MTRRFEHPADSGNHATITRLLQVLRRVDLKKAVKCVSQGIMFSTIGRRFAAALLPRLIGKNPRSHHKGATGRVRTGDQRLPVLCHCQLGQDIPNEREADDLDLKIAKLTCPGPGPSRSY